MPQKLPLFLLFCFLLFAHLPAQDTLFLDDTYGPAPREKAELYLATANLEGQTMGTIGSLENGDWLMKGVIKDGSRNGEWISYWNGKKIKTFNFSNGLLHGKQFVFDGAEPILELSFEEGKPVGKGIQYTSYSGAREFADWEEEVDYSAREFLASDAFLMLEREPSPLNLPEIRQQIQLPEGFDFGDRKRQKVVVRVLVDERGAYVRHIYYREMDSPELMQSVDTALRKLYFFPGLQANKPVPAWITLGFDFWKEEKPKKGKKK